MHAIPKGLEPHFKALGILGVLLVIGDTWLSFKFGLTMGWEMAIIVASISIASGFLLVVALYFKRAGITAMARGMMAAWVAAFGFNCWSNMGVSTSNRMGEIQSATLQRTTYDGRQSKIKEAEASHKLFSSQLQALIEQNGWSASVTADGLRAQAATLDASIAQEGDNRNGGCKRKCLDLMAKKEAIDKQIGVAEQKKDLTSRIEATKTVLGKLRGELADTAGGISNTANQSTLYAKLISWNLAVDPNADMVTVANEATGIASAIVLAILATAVTLAAAWPHLLSVREQPHDGTDHQSGTSYPVSELGNRTPEPRAYSQPLVNVRSLADVMADMRMIQARAA